MKYYLFCSSPSSLSLCLSLSPASLSISVNPKVCSLVCWHFVGFIKKKVFSVPALNGNCGFVEKYGIGWRITHSWHLCSTLPKKEWTENICIWQGKLVLGAKWLGCEQASKIVVTDQQRHDVKWNFHLWRVKYGTYMGACVQAVQHMSPEPSRRVVLRQAISHQNRRRQRMKWRLGNKQNSHVCRLNGDCVK